MVKRLSFIMLLSACLGVQAQTLLTATNSYMDLDPLRDALSMPEGYSVYTLYSTDGVAPTDLSAVSVYMELTSVLDPLWMMTLPVTHMDATNGMARWYLPALAARTYLLEAFAMPVDPSETWKIAAHLLTADAVTVPPTIVVTNIMTIGETTVTNIFAANSTNNIIVNIAISNSPINTINITNQFDNITEQITYYSTGWLTSTGDTIEVQQSGTNFNLEVIGGPTGSGGGPKTMGGAGWGILGTAATNLTYVTTNGIRYIDFELSKNGGRVDAIRQVWTNFTPTRLYVEGWSYGVTGSVKVVAYPHTDAAVTNTFHASGTSRIEQFDFTNTFAGLAAYTFQIGVFPGTATNNFRGTFTLQGAWE